jgi:hypothetical protein
MLARSDRVLDAAERAASAEAKLAKILELCDQSEMGAYGTYGPLIVPTSAIYEVINSA